MNYELISLNEDIPKFLPSFHHHHPPRPGRSPRADARELTARLGKGAEFTAAGAAGGPWETSGP